MIFNDVHGIHGLVLCSIFVLSCSFAQRRTECVTKEIDQLSFDFEPMELEGIIWQKYDVALYAQKFENETWEFNHLKWRDWQSDALAQGARFIFNIHEEQEKTDFDPICQTSSGAHDFNFPAYVMNLAHRLDRQSHTRRLLASLGFSNVSFPTSTPAQHIDIDALVSNGTILYSAVAAIARFSGPGAVAPYIAAVLDRVEALRRGIATGSPLFAIFEDDLTIGACPAQVPVLHLSSTPLPLSLLVRS
jgi:hypothetical protein